MLKEHKDELKRMLEEHKDELKDDTSGMKKKLKKLNENQIVLFRRLEHLNGSSGDVSPAPRFQLRITSKVKDKVAKGESILTEHGDTINIVMYDGDKEIANDHPLASASIMMVVLNGEFNKDDIKCNWTKEDFQKSIRRPREGNSATGDVNKIIESTVSGCTFNLAGGSCSHRDAKISENSSNKKVRLGVMVVSQTEERVLEGLSNRFLVRDRPKKSKEVMEQFLTPLPELAPVDGSSTPGNNTEQATGSRTHGENLQCLVQLLQPPSSYSGGGHFLATTDNMPNTFSYGTNGSEHMSMLPPVQSLSVWPAGGLHSSTISDPCSGPVCGPTGLGGFQHHRTFPVQLLWDRPDVEPSKRWNLLDQLMPLYSRQPKIHNGDFPTMRLMPEHYDSLTTYPQGPYKRLFLMKMTRNLQITTIPKEVMQTHRNRGVLIQPLEPDDSDDEPPPEMKLHNKYQLRFVNKVCEVYYTWELIKADDGNLLNVALYDENNSKITSGPLSSASVEVVVLHGDFNANGQDFWTSEEFSSCVVCPQSGGRSALGGDHDLVLIDGEASVGNVLFQETSSFARTGKFKMGVKMKITIEERIQEGISESFFVTTRRGKGSRSPHSPSAGSANALRRSAKMDITTGAMNTLLPKLAKLLLDEYKLKKRVKVEIEELEQELTSMNVVLRKVSEVPVDQLDEQVRIWARDMGDLSYDIEDAVDTFMVRCKGHKPTNSLSFKVFLDRTIDLYKKAHHEIHSVIKGIMSQVKEASECRDRYKLDDVAAKPATTTVDPRLEAMYIKATELVDVEGSKDELVKRLMEEDGLSRKQPNIVSIVGFGGLGKTTLANALLQDLKAKFDCHFFVSVSLKPDIKKIFENILIQLGEEKSDFQAWDEMQLINKIKKLLENKRCLCIVDDIWEEKVWDNIKLALQDGNQGSKIIITTRKMAVAEHAGGGVHELKPLSDDHSKMLLNKRIFDSEDGCPPDLTEVTEKILKKCGGVPLTIITIASLLANKPRHLQEWEKVNKSISRGLGSSLTVDQMREILSLSYYDLPSHLKTCLLYLSKYPEDMKIRKDVLVWSWIAEGFITDEGHPAGTNLQEVGEGYFNELINRSLIQAVDIVRINEQDGQVHACQVHDMVLELINKLSAEEGFVTVLLSDGQQAGTSAVQKKIRRLSLHAESNTFASTEAREHLSYPHVRSLAAFGELDSMPPLSGFPVLRVLQLEDCRRLQNSHLKDIGEFHLLRFLRLNQAFYVTELPESIGNLHFLEILELDLGGPSTPAVRLPKSFVNLRNLVRLAGGVRLPHGVTLGNMECLQQLVGIIFTEDTMQAIGDLTELRVLKIVLEEGDFVSVPFTETDNFSAYLQRCKNLQDLTIETPAHQLDWLSKGSLDFVEGVPSRLQRFMTDGDFLELPGWINSSLSCLSTLSITLRYMRQEHVMVLAELPSLRFLRIFVSGAPYATPSNERLIIHSGASAFAYLQDLHFYCGSMRITFQPGALPKLRKLYLQTNVRANNSFGLQNLTSLRHVVVEFDVDPSDDSEQDIQRAKDEIRTEINDNPNHPSLDFQTTEEVMSVNL